MSLKALGRRVLPLLKSGASWAIAAARGERLPYSMTFILTHRCNFQCAYCNIPEAAAAEMDEAAWRVAIDEFAAAGTARASFSGGEALLRPDAIPIFTHAKKRGLFTSLNTNGWLVPRHIDALADVMDMMVISVDGPEQTHDLVRAKRGSYRRVLEAIDLARSRGVAVATITVLSHANLGVVDDVLTLAEKHGFWAYFQPAYADCFDDRDGVDPAFTPAFFASLAADLDRARRQGRPVAASQGFLDRLGNGPNFGDCTTCNAGRFFGTVMPDGTLVPCHLVSKRALHPKGRDVGFARAFRTMPSPGPGRGCAISPYQETDLIFHLDLRAIRAAVSRFARPAPAPHVSG